MPIKSEASSGLREQIDCIEKIADRRVARLDLLTLPLPYARWILLSSAALTIEDNYAKYGPLSQGFKASMINLARHVPLLLRALVATYTDYTVEYEWRDDNAALANADLQLMLNYDAFRSCYPWWHQDRYSAELVRDMMVRFTGAVEQKERQVSAYQKGIRSSVNPEDSIVAAQITTTEAVQRKYDRIIREARKSGPHTFSYECPAEFRKKTSLKYLERLEGLSRRSSALSLGPYTLGDFRTCYANLLAVCAIHEHLCHLWHLRSGTYPAGSLVIVKRRTDWIRLVRDNTIVDEPQARRIISDLSYAPKRLPDLHVFPFVPLDDIGETLALMPQPILNSAWEDNILRTCSYLRQSVHDRLSDEKSKQMLRDAVDSARSFHCKHSIPLPSGETDVDLVVEDTGSSTLVIAELKWYRKPSTWAERLRVEDEFNDGFHRQLGAIEKYCTSEPRWLRDRGIIQHSITEYERVYYLLIGRDYWHWIDRTSSRAVIDFEQFSTSIKQHSSLDAAIERLLQYSWLPSEGREFHVRWDRATVGEASLESEVYYGGASRV